MHGNVSEWCGDWYGDYAGGVATDPRGPPYGSRRVFRGGNYRSADRSRDNPSKRFFSLGFRLALSPSGAESPEAAAEETKRPLAIPLNE
jgi:formylglycine-generating enzyme required for sulfatase activity